MGQGYLSWTIKFVPEFSSDSSFYKFSEIVSFKHAEMEARLRNCSGYKTFLNFGKYWDTETSCKYTEF